MSHARRTCTGAQGDRARKPRIEIEVTPAEKVRITADAHAAGIRKLGRYARLVLLKRRPKGGVPATRVIALMERIIRLAEAGDLASIHAHASSVRNALHTARQPALPADA